MPMIILVTIALLSTFVVIIRWILVGEARRRRAFQMAQTIDWQKATKVADLISLYLDVLLTHGPDSHEAKSFRFGVQNTELWKGNESLEVYSAMIDICDNAVRRHKSWKIK